MYKMDLDNKLILMDSSCYCHYKEVLEYAMDHSFNVRCTETRSSLFADTCLAFQQAGFKLQFKEIKKCVLGIELSTVVVDFCLDKPHINDLNPVIVQHISDALEDSFQQTATTAEELLQGSVKSAWIKGGKDVHDRMLRSLIRMM